MLKKKLVEVERVHKELVAFFENTKTVSAQRIDITCLSFVLLSSLIPYRIYSNNSFSITQVSKLSDTMKFQMRKICLLKVKCKESPVSVFTFLSLVNDK